MSEKKDHEEIRKSIASLPEGTKEGAAWEKIGLVQTGEDKGKEKLSREVFRDLWIEIRVPTKAKPKAKAAPIKTEVKK